MVKQILNKKYLKTTVIHKSYIRRLIRKGNVSTRHESIFPVIPASAHFVPRASKLCTVVSNGIKGIQKTIVTGNWKFLFKTYSGFDFNEVILGSRVIWGNKIFVPAGLFNVNSKLHVGIGHRVNQTTQ